MKKQLLTTVLYTVITTVLLGLAYPFAITGIAQLVFPHKANGELLYKNNVLIGSTLIGQPFTGAGYFHSRPSSAGTGYDATSSSGSNYGPTNRALIDRVDASVGVEGSPVPIDLVTASGSGLDPDITPAAALYQVPRLARETHLDPGLLTTLVEAHITQRQFGILGEPRVNVLELNLALDDLKQKEIGDRLARK